MTLDVLPLTIKAFSMRAFHREVTEKNDAERRYVPADWYEATLKVIYPNGDSGKVRRQGATLDSAISAALRAALRREYERHWPKRIRTIR